MIVTLGRETLTGTVRSIKAVIPDPNIVLITGKGTIGDLRNEGLAKCNSTLMSFVDDDIILNKSWYQKCIQALEKYTEVIAVCGKAPYHHTLGCMICRTEEFKKVGGFPKLDDLVLEKLGPKIITLEDAICDHLIKRGLEPLFHNLHFLCHGFQTENRAGWCNTPKKQAWIIYGFLKKGYLDYALGSSIWLIKSLFVIPFILEDLKDKKKSQVRFYPNNE